MFLLPMHIPSIEKVMGRLRMIGGNMSIVQFQARFTSW